MSVITVRVTKEFVETMLKTGCTIDKTVVAEGLPDDAELTGLSISDMDWIELFFTTKKGIDRDVNIVFQSIKDV